MLKRNKLDVYALNCRKCDLKLYLNYFHDENRNLTDIHFQPRNLTYLYDICSVIL